MGRARDEAGNIWETDAQGQAVRLIQAAAANQQPTVTPLPESPQQQRENARKDAGDARDEIRTGIAQRGEASGDRKQAFDVESSLRKEFNSLPEVRDYQTVVRSYTGALKAPRNASGDQALITAYAKMLDPGSVVREQEFATVANADSALGQLEASLKKQFGADNSGMLRPEMRQRILDNMQNLTETFNSAYNQARQRFAQVAQSNQISPDAVIGPHLGQPFYADIEKYRTPAKPQTVGQRAEQNDRRAPPIPFGSNEEGLTGTVSDDYQESYAGQGMSGVNEGLADFLGAPVDLTTTAMNLPIQGLNAIANTGIPTIDRPFLGGQHIRDLMQDWAVYDETNDPAKQFVRRMGRSVGAAALPTTAVATSVPRVVGMLASAAGGGAGAATAQQAFPGNPTAEFIGELVGSGGVGAGIIGSQRRAAQREIEKAVPTIGDLKEQAGNLYRRAEARIGSTDPKATQKLSDDFRQVLMDESRMTPEGRITETYPKAKEAAQLIEDYAGKPMRPGQMDTVRRVIADGLNSTDPGERRIASLLTETFDDWADPLAPELRQARQVSSRYLNAEKIAKARELANSKEAQFSNSGLDNALRTQFGQLDRAAIQGRGRYGQDMQDAIERVNRGTTGSNIARNIGKAAPTGIVPFGMGSTGGATIGSLIGGPVGAVVGGAAVPTIGSIGRATANSMTKRNAELAELIARNGGALPEPSGNLPEIQKLASQLAAALGAGYINPYDN